MTWTQTEAVELCRKLEKVCVPFGCHVALTGGTLYKDGERKDVDILFYNIRQVKELDRHGLLMLLEHKGFIMGKQVGWLQKATLHGKNIDFFFPEAFPSKDLAAGDYDL